MALSCPSPRLGVTQHPVLWSPDFPPPCTQFVESLPRIFTLYLSPQTECRAAAICPALTHSHSRSSRAICHGSFHIFWDFLGLTMFFRSEGASEPPRAEETVSQFDKAVIPGEPSNCGRDPESRRVGSGR